MKIWFQNRRTKWKKQDNISTDQVTEHKSTKKVENKSSKVEHKLNQKSSSYRIRPVANKLKIKISNNSMPSNDSVAILDYESKLFETKICKSRSTETVDSNKIPKVNEVNEI